MKKGDQVEGVVTRVDFPNKGILQTDDGQQVTVKNVIEGQRILCVINKKKSGKMQGRLLEVLTPSPLETEEPICRHFGECGGCSYQTLSYEAQLRLKYAQVQRLLSPVLGDSIWEGVSEGIKQSPCQFAYRNKMEFSFGDNCKDGPLALGMHKRGSFYDIVTVDDCGIIDEDMRQILRHTLLYFSEAQTDFYHKLRHAGYLRNLLVRKASGTGEILIDLITSSDVTSVPQEDVLLENWVKIMCSLPMEGTLVGILHTRNDRPAEVVENQGTQILFGQNYFYETLLGLRFRITPFSFFQTNSAGAEVLYRTVREFITDGDAGVLQGKTIYDLYSGTGTIAQVLSPIAGQVIGVEIIAEAVVAAKENAVENHLDNCRFLTGDVLKILDELRDKPDYIILDPPREGIHPRALEKIIAYGVDRIVYISCKPTSLARDLAVFLAHGYSVTRLCCVDMFPGTVHVETVVLLSKGEIDSKKIRVEFSLEDLDTSGLQRGATYGQIKERVLEQTGLKVSSLYIAQVKQKCGIIERENYNKPKSEDARQPQCPLEKEAAIMDALKHFVMI